MTKVSVIVPVYNVEKYLRKCLDSILIQTFTEFELILIDDGSTDSCSTICDKYASEDGRVHVIHKNNGGVSDARNSGIEKACGEYIAFVDSDDYCDKSWLEGLVQAEQESTADLILSGYVAKNENGETIKKTERMTGEWNLSDEKQIIDYLIHNVLHNGNGWEVWSCLFRTSVIREHNIEFCTSCQNFAEDLGFMLEYLLYCKKVRAIADCNYNYVQHSGSMMSNSREVIKLDSLNEVAIHFGARYLNEIQAKANKEKYAILYYLIMWNQYQKMQLFGDKCREALDVDKQIQNLEWHDHWMKQLIRHRKELERINL